MTKANKYTPTKSKKCRDFFGELSGSVLNELLFWPLTLLPMALVAWIFVTWGALWLIFPLLLLAITLLIWIFRDRK